MKKQPAVLFERLKPFAVAFHQFQGEIDALLAQVPESELDALIAECEQVTDTNCWWAIYEVAPLVKRLAKERRARYKLPPKATEEMRDGIAI